MSVKVEIKDIYDDFSREELVKEIYNLKEQNERGCQQFRGVEERLLSAMSEIDFLRQVILNLTKK